MFNLISSVLIFATLFTAVVYAQEKDDTSLKTVDYVDLTKYAGLWYEIAKIPNSFQDQCYKNTAAKYELEEDGKIKVTNSCVEKEGEIDKTEGIARVVDKKTNAKLEVSFFSILGFRPFWGDYWIIGLDNDYEYAVVGTPSRDYGWILSRTKNLSEEKLQRAYDVLKDNGYDIKKFEKSLQQ